MGEAGWSVPLSDVLVDDELVEAAGSAVRVDLVAAELVGALAHGVARARVGRGGSGETHEAERVQSGLAASAPENLAE